MGIARSTVALAGTDESTGQSVSNNATYNGSELDLLGDDTSSGLLFLYLILTSTVTVGAVNIRINNRRVTSIVYTKPSYQFAYSPINGTVRYDIGYFRVARRVQCDVFNNATGASMTVSVLGELFKQS